MSTYPAILFKFSAYIPVFDNCIPGVDTVVELNITSNFSFTDGVKPAGVCACAIPARTRNRRREGNIIVKIERISSIIFLKEIYAKRSIERGYVYIPPNPHSPHTAPASPTLKPPKTKHHSQLQGFNLRHFTVRWTGMWVFA